MVTLDVAWALGTTAADGADAAPLPTELVATTVIVYGVLLASPAIVHAVPAIVHEAPPGAAVAVKERTGLPPLPSGAVQPTIADLLPAAAATAVGALGTVAGVTGDDASDAAPAPAALDAVTVKLYGTPFCRLPTVQVSVGAVTLAHPVPPAGDDVTV